jgi:hypothetical protein
MDENMNSYRSFETTVAAISRKMTIDFRNSDVSLSIEEHFPLCLDAKYRSSEGTIETIELKTIYAQCRTELTERIFICSKRGSGEFSLPPHRIRFHQDSQENTFTVLSGRYIQYLRDQKGYESDKVSESDDQRL